MARPVWTGSISFGLVNVPVKAYTAVRDHDVHFHQIDTKSGSRIRYRKVAEETGKEVDSDDIVLGFELRKGRYVTSILKSTAFSVSMKGAEFSSMLPVRISSAR